MTDRVADMTVGELRELIREVLFEVFAAYPELVATLTPKPRVEPKQSGARDGTPGDEQGDPPGSPS